MKVQSAVGSSEPKSLGADAFDSVRALRAAIRNALRPSLNEKVAFLQRLLLQPYPLYRQSRSNVKLCERSRQ